MNDTLKQSIIFIAGATIGSVFTWKLLEARCEKRIQEEIAEVKDALKKRYVSDSTTEQESEEDEEDDAEGAGCPDIEKYEALLRKKGYGDCSGSEEVLKGGDQPYSSEAYVISPEDFGEFDDYERITLFYHSDGVLADTDGEIVDDVNEIIGFESLTHFGDYEPDSVHVRNDERKCDYEILRSLDRYSDVIKNKPHLRQEE